ncbi:hypothetical protein DSM104329_05406 [Capillimicrobium parvum]|uniref:Uncharacterized protein n=1 Tax=Capillimicrobium parvum TaxID=2884022 RepID=A0A9E6Y2U5_9ACTN|nr:hypothetical protein DSM104329_05406 [Capillimicrobium parvum]
MKRAGGARPPGPETERPLPHARLRLQATAGLAGAMLRDGSSLMACAAR